MAANAWELTLTPDSFVPDSTAHPSRGVTQNREYLLFDGSTDQTVYSKAFRLPDAYDSTSSITCEIVFSSVTDTSSTNTVQFEVQFEAITPDTDATDSDATSDWDTTVNDVSGTLPGSPAGRLGTISDATIANADMDVAAAGDYIRLKVTHDESDGTTTDDIRLFYLSLYQA